MKLNKFHTIHPTTKEEKLIYEFLKTLKESTTAFVNLNKLSSSPNEIFSALFNGTMAYVGIQMELLTSLLDEDVEKKRAFLKDFEDMFKKYHDHIYKSVK